MEFVWKEKSVELEGRRHRFMVFEHPGSVVVAAMRDGQVALVRQMRPAVDAWLWELPAGTLEPGEQPVEAARRELEEEAGLAARRFEVAASFFLAPGYSSEKMHLVVARDLWEARRRPDPGEFIAEMRWFSLDELAAMAEAGQLQDAKTLAALFFLDRRAR